MADVRLSESADQLAVQQLAGRAERADQVAPLDEATLLALRNGADALHLTVHGQTVRDQLPDDGGLVGYAQLRPDGAGQVAELVVDPDHRRRGIGARLLRALQEQAAGMDRGPLEVWAHGDLPGARALLATVGARPVRELWLLGRDLADLPGPAPAPPGVRLRPFRVGEDEAAWLAVNARAFADHPEQGRTTLADLLVREREPWFDPDGFVLAVADDSGVRPDDRVPEVGPDNRVPEVGPDDRVPEVGPDGSRLLGSNWTKVDQPDVGEIYVLGVDPSAQGMGLGRVLTDAGLAYLAGRGLSRVVLYVESDNHPALATYRTAGFVREAVHTRYRLPSSAG